MDRTRFASRVPSLWQLRSRGLPCGAATLVMGILNVTPDSFSDGGLYRSSDEAAEAALAMYAAGAAIVDVGGESTRPGQHPPLAPQQEVDRVLPVIERILKAQPGAVLSIDTYHAATAAHAVAAGVEIVNDVSGFLWDSAMADTCARLRCGVILMHTRGRPEDWKTLPPIPRPEVVSLVSRELQDRLDAAHAAGVDAGRIVLDPGFGFGKGGEANFALLAGLGEFRMLGRPLLAGVSRKSFLARALRPLHGGIDLPPAARRDATLAAITASILGGASIVRVHEVQPAVEAAAIADAVLDAG